MTETQFIIRPSVDAKPSVEVWLKQLDDRIAWVVGGAVVAVLRPDGRYDRYRIPDNAAKAAGIALDANGFIEAVSGNCDLNDIATLIAHAIQAEREACAEIARTCPTMRENHNLPQSPITLRLIIAQRIRERNKTTEPTKETSTDATVSKP